MGCLHSAGGGEQPPREEKLQEVTHSTEYSGFDSLQLITTPRMVLYNAEKHREMAPKDNKYHTLALARAALAAPLNDIVEATGE